MRASLSAWDNVRTLSRALNDGLLDQVPNSDKIISNALQNPSCLLFMASSSITLRLVARRDLIQYLSARYDWLKLVGDLELLKEAYGKIERLLNDETLKSNATRAVPMHSWQADMLAGEWRLVAQIGVRMGGKVARLVPALSARCERLLAAHEQLRIVGVHSERRALLLRDGLPFVLMHREASVDPFEHSIQLLLEEERAKLFDLAAQQPLVRFTLLSNPRDPGEHFFLWSFDSLLVESAAEAVQLFAQVITAKEARCGKLSKRAPADSAETAARHRGAYGHGAAQDGRQVQGAAVLCDEERQWWHKYLASSKVPTIDRFSTRPLTSASSAPLMLGREELTLPAAPPSVAVLLVAFAQTLQLWCDEEEAESVCVLVDGYVLRVQVNSSIEEAVRSAGASLAQMRARPRCSLQSLAAAMAVPALLYLPSLYCVTPPAPGLVVSVPPARPLALIHTGGMALVLQYDTRLIEQHVACALLRSVATLLSGLLQSGGARPLREVTMVDVTERHTVMGPCNATARPLPDCYVHELVARAAQLAGNRTALESPHERRQLSHAALQHMARSLARRLRAAGAAPGVRVLLYLPRSVGAYVAMLATMRTGACYVPLEPPLPADRLAFIVADAHCTLAVTLGEHRPNLSADLLVLLYEHEEPTLLHHPSAKQERKERPTHAALPPPAELAVYVRYTSGSTGRPKGVVVTHRNLVNVVLASQRALGFGAGDSMLALTTLSFDIAELEYLLPLALGGCCQVVASDVARDALRLGAEVQRPGISFVQATPTSWRMLLDAGWAGNTRLIALCGGEALPRELAAALLPRVGRLLNMYGPTEATVWSHVRRITPADVAETPVGASMPLGAPLDNVQSFVVDRRGALLPRGVLGELLIGGAGVAAGYLNREELTRQRFVLLPALAATPLYRTGDLVRVRADGSMQFVGRIDTQIKLRGFRIEMGEIECVLSAHPGVAACVVSAHAFNDTDDRRLVAYVVPSDASAPPVAAELSSFAAAKLPVFMVPSLYVPIDRIPLSSNGKVDRNALPPPGAQLQRQQSRAPLMAPRNELEKMIVRAFEEVLQRSQIRVDDDFFGMGGHSMLGVHLMSVIQRGCGVQLPFSALLVHRSPTALANLISAARLTSSPLVLLQPRGSRPPIFCVHPAFSSTLCYGALAHHLGDRQPFFGLEPRADYASLEDMAAAYVKQLVEYAPAGPFRVAGWSFGATVAFEMAQQLRKLVPHALIELVVMLRGLTNFSGKMLSANYATLAAIPRDRRLLHVLTLAVEADALPDNMGPDLALEMFARLRNNFVSNEALLRKYRPRRYEHTVTLLRAPEPYSLAGVEDPFLKRADWGWQELAAQVEVHLCPAGDHDTIMFAPHVAQLAELWRNVLRQHEEAREGAGCQS